MQARYRDRPGHFFNLVAILAFSASLSLAISTSYCWLIFLSSALAS